MRFFTQYKTTWLTAISSQRLAASHARMSAFNRHMRQNAFCHVWRELLKICWRVIVTKWRPTTKKNSYQFRNLLGRKKSGHKCTASSSLHETRTVNLALVQS